MPIGPRRTSSRRARPNSSRRGYGSRWQRYATRFLDAHPFCESDECDEFTVSECVDHIDPVTGPDDPGFWRPDNHQALCLSCHSRKTATEDNGRAIR